MLKSTVKSLIPTILILLIIFLVFTNIFPARPSVLLITDFLEAKSVHLFGSFLNGNPAGLITNSNGVPRLALPILLLSPLTSFSANNNLLLIFTNYFLISTSCLLVFKKVNSKINISRIWLALALLTPVLFQSLNYSVSISLTLLSFAIYITSNRKEVKFMAGLLGILSSFSAWPLFFMLVFMGLFRNKSRQSYALYLLTYILIFVALSKGATQEILSYYFPILKPITHKFFIDIHRQADLVGGTPILGMLFYNKYIVVARSVFLGTLKFFDWDFLVFATASDKYTQTGPVFAMLSVFELPILIYGLYLGAKKKINGLVYVLISVFALSLVKDTGDLLPVYWLTIYYILIQGWASLRQNISTSVAFIFILFILLSRFILINHSQDKLSAIENLYTAYSEVTDYVKGTDKNILLTDRLGQPHLFLTYLGAIKLSELEQNMSGITRRDSKGYLQPDKAGHFTFSSFKYDPIKQDKYDAGILIEAEGSFSGISNIAEGKIHKFKTKVDEEGNLMLLEL